jgi:hypothetical protein
MSTLVNSEIARVIIDERLRDAACRRLHQEARVAQRPRLIARFRLRNR